jgi:putative oxidoreductase
MPVSAATTTGRALTITGRALLALLFVLSGLSKILAYQPVLAQMAAHHVPGFLLPLAILIELCGGLALLVGWRVSIAAGALAFFCFVAALLFHFDLANRAEQTLFLKDLALAGALMTIAADPFKA